MRSTLTRLRGKFEGFRAEINPHEWRLPTSYSTSSKDGIKTSVPDPTVFRNALIPNPSLQGTLGGTLVYPDVSHAAVHLALIECFRNLRHSAAELGIVSQAPQLPEYEFAEKAKRSATFEGESDSEHWNTLIRLAIARFETWWTSVEQVFNHAAAYTHYAGDKAVVQLTKDYLPPLDVLLVWYAFMLNTEEYIRACRECDMPQLTQLCFPWPALRDVIDTDAMTFTLPRPAESLFRTMTHQSADIMQYIRKPPVYTEAVVLSPSIDFFQLVKQQEAFFDTAHELLWIRSPSLEGSLERSSLAYLEAQVTNDLYFIASGSVPFGIDLIWRTHRLFPAQYQDFRKTSSDIVPPDQIQQMTTSRPEKTPTRPTQSTDFCACWTCERIRDDVESFRLPVRDLSPNEGTTSISRHSWDPNCLSILSSDRLLSIQDDLGFYHAVQSARRQGLPLPHRPPTSKEKEVQKREKQRREELGRLPGLGEYVEIGKDGKRKIKRSKANRITGGWALV